MPKRPLPEIITMRLPSRLELLSVLDSVTNSICDRMGFDPDTASHVSMSVIEAGTNAIQHGHKRDAARMVDVEFRMWDDRLEVAVHDSGKGFDPQSLNGDATAPEHLFDARGRGIFIMKSCMDAVTFEFDSHGTHVLLVKRLPQVAQAGA